MSTQREQRRAGNELHNQPRWVVPSALPGMAASSQTTEPAENKELSQPLTCQGRLQCGAGAEGQRERPRRAEVCQG